ncbi:MAG: fumarylacetoacetate hydrolase family protein [Pontimonas sp.]|jgi:2-keto-4-pentenoate hydratase/2-oxohepta-3-ene-1,7-dioic acid hydratase in catechol pathway|nr:fumarylacetoacetate hydrolase family protein [Pontimonas sp.]MDP4817260.1 fumarylacetoacetate hydrolase family protein [Pontimonas sp.]
MRIANHDNKAVLLTSDDSGIDIHEASGGKFGPDIQSVYDNWSAFSAWASSASGSSLAIDRAKLAAPSPEPQQIFAIGLNYQAHQKEAGYKVTTELPPVFTKWRSSLTGPDTQVTLPHGGNVDWECELVVVIGEGGRNISAANAWDHVAGLTIGQDFSERIRQQFGQAPQYSLGKSFAGFAPTGPWLVTPDEFSNPDAIRLGSDIDGEVQQNGTTADMICPVPQLLEFLSKIVEFRPGDLIFTGTPSGVGMGQNPKRFLKPGENLRSWIEGIGEIHSTFRAGKPEESGVPIES